MKSNKLGENLMNKTERFWDRAAKRCDKIENRLGENYQWSINKTKKYLNECDIVLDYGCGTGTRTLEFANYVKEIHAIDISSKMLEIAIEKAEKRKIQNVDFTQAIIFDNRLKSESFDVIMAFGILHLLKDNRQVVQRITELLKPGGLFISSTPCLEEKMSLITRLQFSPFSLLGKTGLIPQNFKRFKITELKGLISSESLKMIETENLYHKLTSCFIAVRKI